MILLPSRVEESDLTATNIIHGHASLTDMAFLEDLLFKDRCPEFNGYNTKRMRDMKWTPQAKTAVNYRPLLDMIPAEPDTILTAMCESQRLSEEAGQDYTILTCDQQLCKIAVQVQWNQSESFSRMLIRLGGMHMLMSFLDAIDTLMKGTGLEEIMARVFGGVKKMLDGKKYPDSFRALRFVAEELLRDVVNLENLKQPIN